MMRGAYYNEIDPAAAQWLRNLISAGHIAPGDVDERSIEDVRPDDLKPYTQCHFFAGIGVWSYALRRAGWPDDRPVWTGSCPCQPFSTAGKGAGFSDERHLWPSWFHLIGERKPATIFGEQVASKDAEPWIDLVQDDLEALGYGVGSVPFPSASVGAPHIRDRLYWMANANNAGSQRHWRPESVNGSQGREAAPRHGAEAGELGWMADTNCDGRHKAGQCESEAGRDGAFGDSGAFERAAAASQVNGFWRDADWLFCRDQKWRPVEPGTFPLVDGAAARVVRLRAYGNAINAEQARIFIEAGMTL